MNERDKDRALDRIAHAAAGHYRDRDALNVIRAILTGDEENVLGAQYIAEMRKALTPEQSESLRNARAPRVRNPNRGPAVGSQTEEP